MYSACKVMKGDEVLSLYKHLFLPNTQNKDKETNYDNFKLVHQRAFSIIYSVVGNNAAVVGSVYKIQRRCLQM